MKFGNYCLEEAFNSPDNLVAKFLSTLHDSGVEGLQFDTLVGTGFSGALVVPTLGRAIHKDYLLVRKPGDSHHHGSAIAEGNYNDSGKWLFVDDGIGTGKTYTRVRHAVNKLSRQAGLPDEFVGAYLYGHDVLHGAQLWTPDDLSRNGIRPNYLDRDAREQIDAYHGDEELF